MTIFAPEFKIPSRNTIKSQVYYDKKEKLIMELDQFEFGYYIIKHTQVLVINLLPVYDRKSFYTTG